MPKEPSLHPDYEFSSRTVRGNVALLKPFSSEIWFCHLIRGKLIFKFNHQTLEIGGECYFPAFDGVYFQVLGGSGDMEMEILSFSLQFFNAVYPLLNTEMDSDWAFPGFLTSVDMTPSYRETLALDHRQLQLLLNQADAKGRNKRMTWAVCQYVLTWFNGAPIVAACAKTCEDESSNSGTNILNKFFEILSEKESVKHRDIRYYTGRLGISARYLYKICMSKVNSTPKDMINETVIGEIKHILLITGLTVQQIAFRFDFPDQSSLYQYFKRNVGMTPTGFRERYK